MVAPRAIPIIRPATAARVMVVMSDNPVYLLFSRPPK
jgi:hypothetical protein